MSCQAVAIDIIAVRGKTAAAEGEWEEEGGGGGGAIVKRVRRSKARPEMRKNAEPAALEGRMQEEVRVEPTAAPPSTLPTFINTSKPNEPSVPQWLLYSGGTHWHWVGGTDNGSLCAAQLRVPRQTPKLSPALTSRTSSQCGWNARRRVAEGWESTQVWDAGRCCCLIVIEENIRAFDTPSTLITHFALLLDSGSDPCPGSCLIASTLSTSFTRRGKTEIFSLQA